MVNKESSSHYAMLGTSKKNCVSMGRKMLGKQRTRKFSLSLLLCNLVAISLSQKLYFLMETKVLGRKNSKNCKQHLFFFDVKKKILKGDFWEREKVKQVLEMFQEMEKKGGNL